MEGDLVGVFESAAGREPVGDPGEGDAGGFEEFDEVVGCRLAFDIRAQREDNFGGLAGARSFEERLNSELVGADVVQGSQPTSERVVEAAERAGFFDREDVGGLLDDADFTPAARGLEADLAEVFRRKETALVAGMDGGRGRCQCLSELGGPGIFVRQNPKGDPFGAAGSDTREAAQLARELEKRCRVVDGHGVNVGAPGDRLRSA